MKNVKLNTLSEALQAEIKKDALHEYNNNEEMTALFMELASVSDVEKWKKVSIDALQLNNVLTELNKSVKQNFKISCNGVDAEIALQFDEYYEIVEFLTKKMIEFYLYSRPNYSHKAENVYILEV